MNLPAKTSETFIAALAQAFGLEYDSGDYPKGGRWASLANPDDALDAVLCDLRAEGRWINCKTGQQIPGAQVTAFLHRHDRRKAA